jgi:phage portal protein BeeE
MPKNPIVTTPTGVLPDKYKAAALLEAHGHTRADIAKQLGISQPTVARLRRTPEYQAEVARMSELSVMAVKPLIDQLNTDIITSMSKAIRTLEGQLDAENDDGAPLYGVRTEAAKLLLDAGVKHLAAMARAVAGGSGGSDQHTPVAAQLTVTINHDGAASVHVGDAEEVEDVDEAGDD